MLNDNVEPAGDEPLERLLASFRPIASRIDCDQLMFRAGMSAAQALLVSRPAARLQDRLWPALAMISTAAALVLGVINWQRPAAQVIVVERPAVESPAVAVQPSQAPAQFDVPQLPQSALTDIDPSASYLLQRDRVLRDGPDGLASAVLEGDSYSERALPTQRQLFQELPSEFRRQTFHVDSNHWWQSWLISGDRS